MALFIRKQVQGQYAYQMDGRYQQRHEKILHNYNQIAETEATQIKSKTKGRKFYMTPFLVNVSSMYNVVEKTTILQLNNSIITMYYYVQW